MSAVTLLLAMVANLVLLPTLILWMDRSKRPRSTVQP
jgi:predicted RND superfamily exporter protein